MPRPLISTKEFESRLAGAEGDWPVQHIQIRLRQAKQFLDDAERNVEREGIDGFIDVATALGMIQDACRLAGMENDVCTDVGRTANNVGHEVHRIRHAQETGHTACQKTAGKYP